MATAEEKTTALESQLEKAFKLAESLNKSTDAIIEQGEERKIARQKKNLMEKTEKIHEIKELLREVKVTAETDEQETEAAINEIEERAEVFEDAIDELDLKLINPITYGILPFRQLRGGLFGPDPENKVTVNGLI